VSRASTGRVPVVHYDVHGLVALRLYDAPQHVVDDVTRELGAPQAVATREPDLVVRFVDRMAPSGFLRMLGLHDAAFDEEHFYLLDAQRRRARVDFTRLGEPCEIVCEREIATIPLLIPMLGLYLAAAGHVLLHAASFVHRGHGVLVAGWQKGGKTETLLPFTAAGADFVADEWTVVGGVDRGMYGLSDVARLWDWHLRQVPQYWERISPGQRARLRVPGRCGCCARPARTAAGRGRPSTASRPRSCSAIGCGTAGRPWTGCSSPLWARRRRRRWCRRTPRRWRSAW
jgi:hypothetical protein